MSKNLRFLLWSISTIIVAIFIIFVFSLFPKVFPFTGFVFAVELHFLLMGWFAATTALLKMDFSSSYYDSKEFEKSGKFYLSFGVKYFKNFLFLIGWEKMMASSKAPVSVNLENLKKREIDSCASEWAHGMIAILVLGIIPFLYDSIFDAKWMLLLTILTHVYPVILQRYNRPRFRRAIRYFN